MATIAALLVCIAPIHHEKQDMLFIFIGCALMIHSFWMFDDTIKKSGELRIFQTPESLQYLSVKKTKTKASIMKKGTQVRWTLKDASQGTGIVIADEVDNHVLVAVETQTIGGVTKNLEPFQVIYCAVTWLTVIPT